MFLEAQRNYVTPFFIVLIYFLLSSIICLLPAPPLFKSLPCISGSLGVPKSHGEAVAALSQSTEPARGYSGAIPLGLWVQEPREWALRLLICHRTAPQGLEKPLAPH